MKHHRILVHVRTTVRVVFYGALSTAVVTISGFVGAHYYLERKQPTPSTWPRELRFAYRAALANLDYLDQPAAASFGLRTCLNHLTAQDDDGGDQNHMTSVASSTSLAVPDYAQAFVLLGQIERKQGLLSQAMVHFKEALKDRTSPLLLRSLAARNLGELQERCGLLTEAQENLALAVQCVLPSFQSDQSIQLDSTMTYSTELLDAVKALALLGARQGRLKEALGSLLSILQLQRQPRNNLTQACQTAATMTNIAEVVWALGDEAECRRWNLDSLAVSTSPKNQYQSSCLECAGISYNMLGLLNKRKGDQKEAISLFRQAIIFAERANDAAGVTQYATNMENCI